MIPSEIPDSFRSSAVIPPEAGEYDLAWTPADALAVLSALDSTSLAVETAQAFKVVGSALIPTRDAWLFPATSGDTESSRARKSRAGAASFIRKINPIEVDYVSLEFSYQDEAA
jgi:hypothetical protein